MIGPGSDKKKKIKHKDILSSWNHLNLQRSSQVTPAASRRADIEWQRRVEYSISGKWYCVYSGFCCYCCINLCCKWHFLTHNGYSSLTIQYKNAISYHSYNLKIPSDMEVAMHYKLFYLCTLLTLLTLLPPHTLFKQLLTFEYRL